MGRRLSTVVPALLAKGETMKIAVVCLSLLFGLSAFGLKLGDTDAGDMGYQVGRKIDSCQLNKPLKLDRFMNKTSEHIDKKSILNSINTALKIHPIQPTEAKKGTLVQLNIASTGKGSSKSRSFNYTLSYDVVGTQCKGAVTLQKTLAY